MNPEDATPPNPAMSRPALDAFWLDRLRQEGLSALLPNTPTHPSEFALCVQQLNDGRYFEAHESLEAIWGKAPYPMKLFYYSLIKLSVGLLQIERHNARAARTQLSVAVQYLAPFAPAFMGLKAASLVDQAENRLELLQSAGRVNWPAMDGLQRVVFTTDPNP
jgi:predicted metal-dependent hydrolase